MSMPRRTRIILLLLALLFLCLGIVFLPLLGFEYDEVVFIQPLFHPAQSFASIQLFHHVIPLMQMSYAGALKTWIYAPVFKFYTPNPISVRLPVLFLASFTVFLIGLIVQHCASSKAAVFTCAVLASDLNFLLTSVFDWGPVVIQNLLLTTGLYFLLVQRKKSFSIPCAAFAFGLALWDKALFVWIFSGLAISGVMVGFRVLWRETTTKKLGLVLTALIIGAAPLLIYNFRHHGETFRGNAKLSLAEIGPKFSFLRIAINNQAFKGFFVDQSMPRPAKINSGLLNALYWLALRSRDASSGRFLSFLFLSLVGLVLACPPKRRLILWLELAVLIAWLQAAMTQNAGGFVHHIVIFYPVLFIALGICADEIANRLRNFGNVFLAVAGALLCLTGLNIINAQYVTFHRFSPSTFWTDADGALSQYLTAHKSHPVLIADWGIATQADVRTRGTLPMQEISFSLKDGSLTGKQMREWAKARSLVVLHTAEHTMFPNQNAKLASLATANGLALVPLKTITDQAGHPMFEIDGLLAPSSTK